MKTGTGGIGWGGGDFVGDDVLVVDGEWKKVKFMIDLKALLGVKDCCDVKAWLIGLPSRSVIFW